MNRREFLKNLALTSVWAVIPKKMGESMYEKEVVHAEDSEELVEENRVPSPNPRRPLQKWCSLSYFAVECVPDEFTLCRHCQNL